jgi:hypothetical protein
MESRDVAMRHPFAERAFADVVAILASRMPVACRGMVSSRAQRLGAQGLGFDNVTLAGILLECERHFDMPFPASLLDGEPVTIGRLADHAAAALASRAPVDGHGADQRT